MVVGPYDNNVFVLRCTETGDAVLLDAANEHDKLLELCRRSGSRAYRDPRALGLHPGRAPAARRRLHGARHRRGRRAFLSATTRCSTTTA